MKKHLAVMIVAALIGLTPLHGKGPGEGPKGPQEAPGPNQGSDREPCGDSQACNGK